MGRLQARRYRQRGTVGDCVLSAAPGRTILFNSHYWKNRSTITVIYRLSGAPTAHAEMLPAENVAAGQCLACLEELLRQQLASASPDVARLRCAP